MKKLLFLTAFPPNHRSGGQTFSLNLLKDLSEKYIVDLIYFIYKDHVVDKKLQVNSIKSFKINNLNSLHHFTKHPLFTRRFNKEILEYINQIVNKNKYDIVFFDYTQVGLYSLYVDHPHKIIRCHDILFQKFSRKGRIFKYWIKNTEEKIIKSVEKIFVVSEKDALLVDSYYKVSSFFTNEKINKFDFFDLDNSENRFVFFGLWSRPENLDGLLWFVKKVMPKIKLDDGIKFLIIGGGLSDKINKTYLSHYKNIEYRGFVEDPLDIIYMSLGMIAPLFAGAGVKVKVIDAFTTGTPVIGTDITFEGLPYIENLTIKANKPDEYVTLLKSFSVLSSSEKRKNAQMFRELYDNNHFSDYF